MGSLVVPIGIKRVDWVQWRRDIIRHAKNEPAKLDKWASKQEITNGN